MAKILNSLKNFELFKKKRYKKKVALCHGVFDLLHLGHIKYFKASKRISDLLVLSITSDKFVNKGPERPVFNINQRIEMLNSISAIDYIIVSDSFNAVEVIKKIKPNYYFKDQEYKIKKDITNNIKKEIKEVNKYNGEVIFTKEEKFSSSELLKLTKNFSISKNFEFINKVSLKFKNKNIIEKLENTNLNCLVLGETIMDKYIFTEGLGKSGKESILTVKKIFEKTYNGGSLSVAQNISEFLNKVSLITDAAEVNFYKKLPKNITVTSVSKKDSPLITKSKFIDNFSKNKLFGLYEINDRILNKKEESSLIAKLKKQIPKSDFIIICDYDHGFITENVAKYIISQKKPIIVTCQLNAANTSFHNLLKLNGADLLIVNSNEIKNFYKRKSTEENTKILGEKFLRENKYKNLIVTMGDKGSFFFQKNKTTYCPAFTENVQGDKIGSGDTYLILSSIGFILKLDPEVTLSIASIAAIENLKGFANENLLKKKNILKSINHFFLC
jgi:rfaE bifunctional protein nucleotidyltransferase chain/domain